MPSRPMTARCLPGYASRSSVERTPRSVAVRVEERRRRAAALVAQHAEERPLGEELGGIAEVEHDVARDAVDAHLRPHRALARARDRPTCRSSAATRSSLISVALKAISFSRLWISRAVLRRARPLDRVDLHQDRVRRRALPDQRRHRRVARVAAVPVRLAVDLHRLEHRRQARRGEQHVGRELGIAEDAAAAGAHVGRGDEELDRRARRAGRNRRCPPGSGVSGFEPKGLMSYGESTRAAMSRTANTGE